MNRNLRFAILSLTALAMTTGCAQTLSDMVRVAKPVVAPVAPVVAADAVSTIKISPGNTVATSSDVSMKAHVTITDRPLIGSDVSARVTVNRQRGTETH